MVGNELSRWRLFVVFTVALAFTLVIVGRLVYLQVVRYDHYLALASSEHWREEEVAPRRGSILDSEGHVLATSVDYDSLYVDPQRVPITNPDRIATVLSPILNEPIESLAKKLSRGGAAPILLKKWLAPEAADQVRQLNLDGVSLFFKTEPKRVYPEGSVAPDVLGFVGTDGNGLAGLELSWNGDKDDPDPQPLVLSGKPGKLIAERDTEGQEIALGARNYTPPVDGVTIKLTIDRQLQRIVERECDASVKEWLADACSAIIMDPKTGAILAMGSSPRFDLTDPDLLDKPAATFKNRNIQETWEPGSVFKAVTMASGIDAGAVTPDTKFNDVGVLSAFGLTVHNWNMTGPGWTDMTDALARSSNVGLGTVSMRLGAERFYEYVHRFGFGRPTGIRFPGEASGIVDDPNAPNWFKGNLITNAFGQGISVSPLQMITAVAAIANGGGLMKPYLVQSVYDSNGQLVQETAPEVVSRIISPKSATDTAMMMKAVVDRSPTHPMVISGYDISGKSGTAEIPTATGYAASDETEATFLAFLPTENPELVLMVRLTRPRKNEWSEVAAAPTLRKITVQTIARRKIMPNNGTVVDIGKPSARVLVTDTVALGQTPVAGPAPTRAPAPAVANNAPATTSAGAAAGSTTATSSGAQSRPQNTAPVRQPTPTAARAVPAAPAQVAQPTAVPPTPVRAAAPASTGQSVAPPAPAPTAPRAAPQPTAVPTRAPVQPTPKPAVAATPAGAPALPPPVNPASVPAPARPAVQPTPARPAATPAGSR